MPAPARAAALSRALLADDASDRLQAALTAGTHPDESFLDPLVARCAVEPDFYVRDMLTWALTRLPRDLVLDRLLGELSSAAPQARSQALHTLSKLGDPRGWPAITAEHLHDDDAEVARAAWRTAAGLAPEDEHPALAGELVLELGRGDIEVMRSLSRALVELGEAAVPLVRGADDGSALQRARHARATLRLIEDPEASFTLDGA
ncbi:HEAT repeat domain-containing protein [Leucobacter chironomi]|uniref:HEAT repeat domain-containing protein n=1 Tax=Leucobacter chironomi TaxID=491918 RepID=UPI00040D5035|nr:HEAT repeat domain-containing protein [Leucobacter chironomi]